MINALEMTTKTVQTSFHLHLTLSQWTLETQVETSYGRTQFSQASPDRKTYRITPT
jgi:hypothetical protein